LRAALGHATTRAVTTAHGDSAAAARADTFARDWQALRADGDIQFAPIAMPELPPTPEWLRALGEFLKSVLRLLGTPGQAVIWVLVALALALTAALAWRYLRSRARRPTAAEAAGPEWTPDTNDALALLDDADRLAGAGRYDEATHLLLKRSVGQIAAARPDLLVPSSTAREIAELRALPEAARGAFVVIAERVERSLFALRGLSAADWHAARAAYADFALSAPKLA